MMRRWGMLLWALLACWSMAGAQPAGGQVIVMGTPAVDDGMVQVQVRFEQVNPQRLQALGAANFSVSEPAADLTVTRQPLTPHALVLLVPVNFGADLNHIQASLRAYTDSYLTAQDRVLLLVQDARGVTATEANTRAALAEAIAAITPPRNYPRLDNLLTPALAWLSDQPDSAVRMGLMVTSYLNAGEDVSAAAAFGAAGFPLHVVQAHTFRTEATGPLSRLAEQTGGLFVENRAGALSQGTPPIASGSLKVLYDNLAITRDVFAVRYRPIGTRLEATPTVTLTVNLTLTQAVSTTFSYQRAFSPPTVSFSQQTIAPIRRPSLGPAGLLYDIDSQGIGVRVTFGDNVPRRIASLQLEVLDVESGAVLQSSVEVNPQPDAFGGYRAVWSLADFIDPGRLYLVLLRVTVTDELGLSATAEQRAGVTVAALPATATPSPTVTPPPSPTPEVTATLPVTAAPALTGTDATPPLAQDAGSPLVPVLMGVSGGLAALVLILLLALLRARSAAPATSTAAVSGGPSVMDIPTPLPDDLGSGAPPAVVNERRQIYGRLLVKRGLPAGEILIMSEEFVIGRKADSDVHYQIDKPVVTPRHCLITHRRGRFTIRDLNSKNGTYVNGERLMPERELIVPIGSEIAVTQNIVFELWDAHTVVKVDYQGDGLRSDRVTDDSGVRTNQPSRFNSTSHSSVEGEPIDDDYSPI